MAKQNSDDALSLARSSLAAYAALVYDSYCVYRHHSILIRHLEAIERGEIRRLIISMPPRSGKSLTVSEIFPAWYLGHHPDRSVIIGSYNQEFAESNFGRKVRNYVADPRTRAVFPDLRLADDSQSVKRFDTTTGGSFFAVGRGGALTGRGGHLIILDDTLKDWEEARSEAVRRELHNWFRTVVYTRRQPETAIIQVATRWHADDCAGFCLRNFPEENWTVLSMPAIAEVDEGWRKAGEALWPERFPIEDLEATKRVTGTAGWAALYQQRPVPEEGAIFKGEWLRRYDELPPFSQVVISADTAFAVGKHNDYSAITVWGVAENGYYLLHVTRERLEFPALKRELISLAAQWKPNVVLIEKAASGQSLLQELDHATRLPIRAVPVDRDKVTRAHACAPIVEAGRVFLPKSAPWLADYIDELQGFPGGAPHDDCVDSTTQFLNYVRDRMGTLGLVEFLKQAAGVPGTPSEQAKVIAFAKPPGNVPATAESGLRCPACESTIIQKIPGGKRCGMCGTQFGMPTFTSHSSQMRA